MHRDGGELVLSPTDLTKHLGCRHITTLDLLRLDTPPGAAGDVAADDALDLVVRLGLAHEAAYLRQLRDEGRSVAQIRPPDATTVRAERERETFEAMQAGVDVVYQGTFDDGMWGGQADFLLRVETPSNLGAWSYEIADTKLARHLKVPALLQMAMYADRLQTLQGVAPRRLVVVTGDGAARPWRLVDVAAFARRARSRLRAAIETGAPTSPVPVPQCAQCRWAERCAEQWRTADDLSLVAGMRADHRHALQEHGITTTAQLGGCGPDDLPRAIGRSSRERLAAQAALQLRERVTGLPAVELLEPRNGLGLQRLPEPDDGDLYLDFEGDPYAEGGEGREYLAGIGDRLGGFQALWAHSRPQERDLTAALVDRLLAGWREHPGMHVYHYAPYETAALKRLVQRHGVREAELDQLLRGERFVDLYAVVRQGIRISKESYSLKQLEAFYWGHSRAGDVDEVADAMGSVVAYERWAAVGGDAILTGIETYNRQDVESTLALHGWLEQRRDELVARAGPLSREAPGEDLTDPGALELAEIALAERLTAAGEELLAALVQFHRREARPAYWEVFRLTGLDDEQLVDDSAAIGQVSAPTTVGVDKRSSLYRYDFPPQDTKLGVADTAYDVDTQDSVGTVVEIDAVAGYVVVKRAKEPRTPRGLSEKSVVGDQVMRDAVAAVAEDRLAGRDCLGSALLDRLVPDELGDVVTAGRSLVGRVLAVQGPPGSGKTRQAAELVRALLDDGKRVGITANSHSVVGHLLAEVDRPALQKCPPADVSRGANVVATNDNAEVGDALATGRHRLVGGTAWLWARPDLADSLDVLVVEEAGQFSLANAVATSRSARAVILLGDPQQLAQPTRALHPAGAGASALGHLLGGHETIRPDDGIFLGTTWRMHPSITAFVSDLAYDGRLRSAPDLQHQEVDVPGLVGSGIAVRYVEHEGNAAASEEEADEVAALWHRLVAGTFTHRTGATRPMTAGDVLVVAPYNNHVGLLRQRLPAGARVGTVDKFQGQQAPVVVYSTASSSVDDAPRGIGFLYDTHRLNVAVSRAQALAVVVMSPRLLDAAVHDPEQLRQVNALCRLVELAHPC